MHYCNEPFESYNFTKICQIFISEMSTISDLTNHIMIPGAGIQNSRMSTGSLASFGLTGSRCSQATRLAASPLDFALAATPTAVIRVVTQRFSPTSGGEALRDDPNNGCEGDQATPRALVLQLSLLAGYFVALSGSLTALSCGENQEERIIKKNLRDQGIDCFACCMSLFGLAQHKT